MTDLIQCYSCGQTTSSFWFSGEAKRTEWLSNNTWNIYRCSSCNHKVIHPTPTFDELSSFYNSSYAPYTKNEHTSQRNLYKKEASTFGTMRGIGVDKSLSYLDVGCGAGGLLGALSDFGCHVQGIEPSEHGAKVCIDNGIPTFHGFLHEYIQDTDNKFDVVTCNHVVEHHPDPKTLLNQLGGCLKENGNLVFAVPNAACYFAEALKDDWHSFDLPVHLHHFSLQSITKCVTDAGLDIVDIRTESENSLAGSLALLLRQRMLIPQRVTQFIFASLLSKHGSLGRYLDQHGEGEAVIVTAKPIPRD